VTESRRLRPSFLATSYFRVLAEGKEESEIEGKGGGREKGAVEVVFRPVKFTPTASFAKQLVREGDTNRRTKEEGEGRKRGWEGEVNIHFFFYRCTS